MTPGSPGLEVLVATVGYFSGALLHGIVLRLIARRFALAALPGITARDAALMTHGAPAMGDLTNALTF